MRNNFSVVLLAAVLLCALWACTAWAAIPTTTWNSTNLPTAGGGGTITAAGVNIAFDNAGADGTVWRATDLVASGDVGTDTFVWTARFPALTYTGGIFQLDNSSGPGDAVGRSLSIDGTTITFAAPAGTGPTAPRPAGAFRLQLERTASQYVARLDNNDDSTFETTIGTFAMTPAARPIGIVITEGDAVPVVSISIAPGAAPPPPAPVPQATPSASAPTMSVWGLGLLAVVLVAVAALSLRQWRIRRAN